MSVFPIESNLPSKMTALSLSLSLSLYFLLHRSSVLLKDYLIFNKCFYNGLIEVGPVCKIWILIRYIRSKSNVK